MRKSTREPGEECTCDYGYKVNRELHSLECEWRRLQEYLLDLEFERRREFEDSVEGDGDV